MFEINIYSVSVVIWSSTRNGYYNIIIFDHDISHFPFAYNLYGLHEAGEQREM